MDLMLQNVPADLAKRLLNKKYAEVAFRDGMLSCNYIIYVLKCIYSRGKKGKGFQLLVRIVFICNRITANMSSCIQ